MSVLKPRNRLVYFRVSEDEFQQLSDICGTAGARSISDLARVAVHRMIRDGAQDSQNVVVRLQAIEAIMSALDHKLNQVAALLRGA